MLEITPEFDESGNVVPHDNLALDNEGLVIRRVPVDVVIETENGPKIVSTMIVTKKGRTRLSSMILQVSSKGNKGMSVDLEDLILSDEVDPIQHVTSPKWLGSISIRVGEYRNKGFLVGYDPIEGANIYHGEVWGNFTKKLQKHFLGLAEWYVPIPDVSII